MSVAIVEGELLCPFCGGNYLHQGRTSVFERGEDDEECALTVVEDFVTTVNPKASNKGNPSTRRHGMTVEFGCEFSGSHPNPEAAIVLCIAQHKGVTEVYWQHEGR
jgi:hypothetical protein